MGEGASGEALFTVGTLMTLLVLPGLLRPAARPWAILFLATLAIWIGLWTLPVLWSVHQRTDEHWNWSGSVLAMGGTLCISALLARQGGPAWREMGFTWAQRPGSIMPAIGMTLVALSMQAVLTISSGHAPPPVSPETWLYQSTLPGLVEETTFRGVLLAVLDRAFRTRATLLGAPLGWGGVVVTLGFVLLHPLTASSLLAVGPPALVFLWLRARTGSLVFPVLVHSAWNLVAYLTGG